VERGLWTRWSAQGDGAEAEVEARADACADACADARWEARARARSDPRTGATAASYADAEAHGVAAALLLVDACPAMRVRLADALRAAGHPVAAAAGASEALARAENAPCEVVVASARGPAGGGLAVLRALRGRIDVPCVLYGPGVGARDGFEAARAGALGFVERPLPIEAELLPALAAWRRGARAAERRGADRLVGSSLAMRRVRAAIRRVAPRATSVLVEGETGTGKELVALALHEESGRAPFVAVSLPELASGLLESELFGHRRGAFTGAVGERAGLFEAADGGTLFLDEVGDAPLALQAKLLRALETREVRRVGGGAPRRVDVRVVAATNRDLAERVRRGAFREDLYYRIRGALVRLPPLRERAGDLAGLAQALLAELGARDGDPAPALAPDALALLAGLPWRGNVRELRALLENALLWRRGGGFLSRADVLEALASLEPGLGADACALTVQLLDAWRRHGWNQEAARRELGLSRSAWRSRLARAGLDVARRRRLGAARSAAERLVADESAAEGPVSERPGAE